MKRLALLFVFATGCSDPEWVGTYTTTGQWNLSGPLSDGRSAGDAIADLFIDQLAETAPVASEELEGALSTLFRDRLRMFVDSRAPAELRAGGAVTGLLASSLADVRVESVVELEEDGDDVEGEEKFNVFELTDSVGVLRLTPVDLGESEIEAEWAGPASDDRFELEPHEVSINYGKLVELAAAHAIAAADLESLTNGLLAAVECGALVNAALDGEPSYVVDVVGIDFTVDADTLETACNVVRTVIGERALGLFGLNSAVEIGGVVTWADANGDGMIELSSGADFGGIVAVAPDPIAPKIRVSFQGAMQ